VWLWSGIEFRVRVGVNDLVWDGNAYGLGFGGIDDSGGVVGVDLGQGAQKQTTDIGENGGTAGRDAVLGQEFVEVLQGMVDALGGLEAFEIADELKVVIGGLLLDLFGAMLATEAGVRVRNGKTAAAACGGVMGTTGHWNDGISSFWFHFFPRGKSGGTPTPGGFCQRVRKHLKTKEMRFCRAQKSAQG
jgi:hypothetical protein